MFKYLASLLMALCLTVPSLAQGHSDFTPEELLAPLPVQSGGRMKPLDTLAKESVRLVTGKSEFQGQNPVLTLLGWWANPEQTQKAQLIEFRDLEAKKLLGLEDRRWYSLEELSGNKKLEEVREEIHQRLRAEEELKGNEEKIQELLGKMSVLNSAMDGSLIAAVPNPAGMNESWGSFADLDHAKTVPLVEATKTAVGKLRAALVKADPGQLAQAAMEARTQLHQLGPVPEEGAMMREVRYNSSHPFRKAWMLYLAGLVVLLFVKSENGPRTTGYWAGFSLIAAGFLVHVYGFALRCIIAGRPPVTNMYESVIWVAFGAVLFAFILEMVSPKRWYLMSAAAGAVVCLVLADILPTVLDPSIRPLTPVLRSNFWLTIHVLSITLGYAGFMLALGLGHVVLWKSAVSPEKKEQIASIHDGVYRAIQVGVLFLAAGTILGGVWANYSWGRFWGWDPKEVWALIALLGYLAILHGRYAGWLRKFGTAAWSIIAFQGVLMAWYGVNYVLGAGLHSYGFGTGGSHYVGIYVLLELLFVAWATWKHRRNQLPAGAKA